MPRLKGDAPRAPRLPSSRPAEKAAVPTPAEAEKPTAQDVMERGSVSTAALRALALETRTPEAANDNTGAEAATLGARLMGLGRSRNARRALAVIGLGCSFVGMAQGTAKADVLFLEAGNDVHVAQAARELATQVGEDFTLVRPSRDALQVAFQNAAAGKTDMRHLILSSSGGGVDVALLQEMKAAYPAAFAQVEHVHVIGEDVSQDPFDGKAAELFPNATAVVSFRVEAGGDDGPASAWLLKGSTEVMREAAPTLSPAQALIKAKSIAGAGKDQGAAIRVSVLGQDAVESAPTDATGVDLTGAASVQGAHPLALGAGVGEGQPNEAADVEAVQQRLKDLGFSIGVDGKYGGETRRTLQTFASAIAGYEYVAQARPIAIEPGGVLHRALEAPECPRWVEMPAEGTGFKNADWDKHDFGSSVLADVIERTGQRYHDDWLSTHPDASVIHTNDASRSRGGDTSDHETHEAGLDLDVRLPRTDGESGARVTWAVYDRDAARAMIRAFIQDPQVERVLIGDKTLLTEFRASHDPDARKVEDGGRGHRDHLHVDIAPLKLVVGSS